MPEYNKPGDTVSFEKLKELDALFDQQLKGSWEKSGTSGSTSAGSAGNRWSLGKAFRWLAGLLLMMILPFWVLIRTSLYFYSSFALNGWISLAGGAGATAILLMLYALLANYLISGSVSLHKYLRRTLVALVLLFCCYGLLHVSALNVKDSASVQHYRSLHPILRISTASAILFYRDLLITDMERAPADYAVMGLPENERSLHYPQATGYIHALDLRTAGRAEWKNRLLETGFRLLGMNTLRHAGTADHLHIALPVNAERG